jgi:cobalt-zinc-cadmium resistance protein CzcA
MCGGQFETLKAARQRLSIVVPACFFVIFLLLMSALGPARDIMLVFRAVPLALTSSVLAPGCAAYLSVSAAVGFIALSFGDLMSEPPAITFSPSREPATSIRNIESALTICSFSEVG